MAFLNFLFQPKNELEPGGRSAVPAASDAMEPERTCPNCHRTTALSALWENLNTCSCGYCFRMSARQRLHYLTDKGSFTELFTDVLPADPLAFPRYAEKLETTRASSRETEAVVCGTASIGGAACAVFIMDPYFMMGSMGTAVGERITRTFEYAAAHRLPVVGAAVSGGARMQEGLFSLMQMAKTSGALERHQEAGLPYIVIMTHPTTAGVTASFASLGDLIVAEPDALIGFAGPRVIKDTTQANLPEGFQTSEFLLKKGLIDRIIDRRNLRAEISLCLEYFTSRANSKGSQKKETAK